MSDLFGNHIVGFSTRWLKLKHLNTFNLIIVGNLAVLGFMPGCHGQFFFEDYLSQKLWP